MPRRQSLFVALLTILGVATILRAETYYVYYLGGQSNMDGFGTISELPENLKGPVEGVYIFHGNQGLDGATGGMGEGLYPGGLGLWSALRPGHGWGFISNGETNTYGTRFGVELSFGRRMREMYPARKIALIKYSRGGTAISSSSAAAGQQQFGCWAATQSNPPLPRKEYNQYDHFLATLRNAFKSRDIDGDGEKDTLIPAGIVWMQGESDSGTPEVAKAYEANLKELMDLIRAAFKNDDLPIVIGRISDSGQGQGVNGKVWPYGDIVREGQAMFCDKDNRASLVTTTDIYGYSDPYHYDTRGFLDLGMTFADTIVKIEAMSPRKPE